MHDQLQIKQMVIWWCMLIWKAKFVPDHHKTGNGLNERHPLSKRFVCSIPHVNGATNKPQPDIPILLFYSDGIYERQLISPLIFSRLLSPCLFVTSKIITRKRLNDDWRTCTHERTLTEWYTEYIDIQSTLTQYAEALGYTRKITNPPSSWMITKLIRELFIREPNLPRSC